MVASMSKKRILQEAKVNAELRQERAKIGITLDPVSYENVYKWDARIQFTNKDSPFYDQIYYLIVEIPNDYPQYPPKITFKAQIFHPNIEKRSGLICKNFYSLAQWSTQNTIFTSLLAVQQLIDNPVWTDINNQEAFQLWRTDFDDFQKIAQSVWALNPVDFKSKIYRFPIPYTEQTQLEESLFLKHQESPTFYFQGRQHVNKTRTKSAFYNERKCHNNFIKDSMNFIHTGELDDEIQSIFSRKKYANHSGQRLINSYAGQTEIKTKIPQITKVQPKCKVNYDQLNNLFVTQRDNQYGITAQSQNLKFRRSNLKSAPLAPFNVCKYDETTNVQDLIISQVGYQKPQ
ncbi:Ubiquitin-conjugating enzyme E2 [Spironucleus salmonicida]|uniref:Ubiquitin-conjugating enzyme E2 n=1 Tax=Spironucleus salmonicida TaxID=348837 RepID=V6LTA3_9EUKA|nr:Ubiquitin-conjugating enzyme E2 [Spironucleus salmonicida]|eukprot:EST44019.1 Ubiquitin-conjugating enzyme E2 [Spironucleus salmonicida]